MGKISALCGVTLVFFLHVHHAYGHALWRPDGLVPPRDNRNDLKVGPCGNVPRGDTPTYLQAGATIEVEMESVIFHDGYYRIAFSPANDADFDSYVLADNIPDIEGQQYFRQSITLPDIECDDCTLQLIQVMLDRNPPTNYYSCADIVLTASGLPETDPQDTQAPGDVALTLDEVSANGVSLSWLNPADDDFFQVLITRAASADINSARPQAGTAYQLGDVLGNSAVVYSGAGTAFLDSGLLARSPYIYKAFAYDRSLNYSPGATLPVTTAGGNSAPRVSLAAEQNFLLTTRLRADGGQVVVQATVNDRDTGDRHRYDWSATDGALVDVDNAEAVFTFDPASLAAGVYTARLTVSDNGEPALSDSAEIVLTLSETDSDEGAPSPTPGPEPGGDGEQNGDLAAGEDATSSGAGSGDAPGLVILLALLFTGRLQGRAIVTPLRCKLRRALP